MQSMSDETVLHHLGICMAKTGANIQVLRHMKFLVNSLSPFPSCQNGNTALAIARRLGYISVVDTLKVVTEETITTTVSGGCQAWLP